MKPRLHPAQAAWLSEIGVDMHWLDVQPDRGVVRRPAPEARLAEEAGSDPQAPVILRAPPVAASQGPVQPQRPPAGGPHPEARAIARPRVDADPGDAGSTGSDSGGTDIPGDTLPDLPSLAAAVQACRRCVRHEQRIRAVPGAGSASRPRYLIVGEQPGIEDEVSGLPFQGDAGRLLEAMLAAVRLPDAQSVHHTYVVKCRAAVGREPDAAEVAACLPYLRREIALLQPRWILALGRVAAQAVLGVQSDLDTLRGGPYHYAPAPGVDIPVWVTHQPASLLVRSALKAEAWRDLVGLAQAAQAMPADEAR